MRQPTLALLGVLATLSIAARVTAQAAPSIEQWKQTLAHLRHELRYKALKAPTDEDRKALVEPERKLREFAAALEQRAGLTVEHYERACETFAMWYPDVSLRIAEAGTKHLPKAHDLHRLAGDLSQVAASRLCPGAARLALVRSGATAYGRAIECTPDDWRPHAGRAQALAHLGRGDEAVTEMQLAMRTPEGRDFFAVQEGPMLLLEIGRPREALQMLRAATDAEIAKRKWLTKADLSILEVRALALSGEAAAAVDAIARLRSLESSSRTVLEAADALAYLGRKEDALKALAEQAVVTESAKEPAWERELYGKAVAVMRALWTADDFSPTGPLRAALTKALDYHVLVTDQGTQIDLASSPIAICRLLGRSPQEAEGVTSWADHVLFVLSAYAATSHHPTATEQRALAEWARNGDTMPGVADVPGCLLSMRGLVAHSGGPATLTALRAAEKFEAMAKAPQPAKPTAPRSK